ncbi:hypothetical protein DFS34DRAFT_627357 [Phlyctochytrium arcticum]|nr:hypothetical protein DFS34DRAFT_627357 [Phlyctochytrium arcticum]
MKGKAAKQTITDATSEYFVKNPLDRWSFAHFENTLKRKGFSAVDVPAAWQDGLYQQRRAIQHTTRSLNPPTAQPRTTVLRSPNVGVVLNGDVNGNHNIIANQYERNLDSPVRTRAAQKAKASIQPTISYDREVPEGAGGPTMVNDADTIFMATDLMRRVEEVESICNNDAQLWGIISQYIEMAQQDEDESLKQRGRHLLNRFWFANMVEATSSSPNTEETVRAYHVRMWLQRDGVACPNVAASLEVLGRTQLIKTPSWWQTVLRIAPKDATCVPFHCFSSLLDALERMRTNESIGHEEDVHPLLPTLQPFAKTVFTELRTLPPSRGEDDFQIEIEGVAKPLSVPLRAMGPNELEELQRQITLLLAKG